MTLLFLFLIGYSGVVFPTMVSQITENSNRASRKLQKSTFMVYTQGERVLSRRRFLITFEKDLMVLVKIVLYFHPYGDISTVLHGYDR